MSQIPPNFKSHPKGLKIPLDQRLTEIAYDRKYELEKDQLSFGNMVRSIYYRMHWGANLQLGVGQFGKVCQGTLTRGEEGTQEPTTVAIKRKHFFLLLPEVCLLKNLLLEAIRNIRQCWFKN